MVANRYATRVNFGFFWIQRLPPTRLTNYVAFVVTNITCCHLKWYENLAEVQISGSFFVCLEPFLWVEWSWTLSTHSCCSWLLFNCVTRPRSFNLALPPALLLSSTWTPHGNDHPWRATSQFPIWNRHRSCKHIRHPSFLGSLKQHPKTLAQLLAQSQRFMII